MGRRSNQFQFAVSERNGSLFINFRGNRSFFSEFYSLKTVTATKNFIEIYTPQSAEIPAENLQLLSAFYLQSVNRLFVTNPFRKQHL